MGFFRYNVEIKMKKNEADLHRLESSRHFVSKELRYSVALIVISSLAAGIVFILLAKALGTVINPAYVPFIIMIGYVAIVILLTMIFSHRFVGPFPRLKMEMRIILGGEYSRRLRIRTKDDIYIRSFIDELNLLLEEFEKMHRLKLEFIKSADADLQALSSCVVSEDMTKEELVKKIQQCRANVGELIKKYRYRYSRGQDDQVS